MNLKTLTEQRADKQNEMETLLNTVEAEQRAFTDEENEPREIQNFAHDYLCFNGLGQDSNPVFLLKKYIIY